MGQGPYKVSVLGDWRSGRSSVVSVLSGKPCPNHPGIQVTRWRSPRGGTLLDIWDVNSRSTLETLGQTFLGGADALVAVADATRAESLRAACDALQAALAMLGPRPACLLLNKMDRLAAPPPLPTRLDGVPVLAVSAARGEGVGEAFTALAERLAAH
jgi:GTPase SAR1 family protein